MPLLIVQMGHCYRKSGATGTSGEQDYATAVGHACMLHLDGVGGWRVRTTLADVDDYRADAFFAVHCDGSTSASARGASAGYQTAEGQALAQSWKRAYAARGWPIFRPDNYTAALAGYYGVSNAVAAGTRRAMIAECGFLTNPEDRDLLLAPDGPGRVALALGDALGITQPPTRTIEDDDMYLINQPTPGAPERWAHVTGKMIMGLTTNELVDARKQVAEGKVPARWVDTATWDAWVNIRNVETDNRELLKLATSQLSMVTDLLGQLLTVVEATNEPDIAQATDGANVAEFEGRMP